MDAEIQNIIKHVQVLLDKQAITEQLMRYCRGIDRMDRNLAESVYWPDATDDHVVYKGSGHGFIDFAFERIRNQRTTHTMGNILIEMQDETHARCESYVQACHYVSGGPYGNIEFFVGARYLDKFEKRDNEWRLKDRVVVMDSIRQMAATGDVGVGLYSESENPTGRYPNDPFYRLS